MFYLKQLSPHNCLYKENKRNLLWQFAKKLKNIGEVRKIRKIKDINIGYLSKSSVQNAHQTKMKI